MYIYYIALSSQLQVIYMISEKYDQASVCVRLTVCAPMYLSSIKPLW